MIDEKSDFAAGADVQVKVVMQGGQAVLLARGPWFLVTFVETIVDRDTSAATSTTLPTHFTFFETLVDRVLAFRRHFHDTSRSRRRCSSTWRAP